MSDACETSVSMERLLDYFSGELGPAESGDVESHLFQCTACSAEAERLAGLLSSVTATVPPVLSAAVLAGLERDGRVQSVNVMRAGETATVFYPDVNRVLVHRLGGIELAGTGRVDLEIRRKSGDNVWRHEDVPFDPEKGEVLVACQSHFADTFPHDIVFTVTSVSNERHEAVASYTVLHKLA